MSQAEDYLLARRPQALEDLKQLLRVKSVSTDPTKKQELARCAELVKARLLRAGLQAEILPTGGHPVVYGERLGAPGKPTVLVYGHYDVQPPDPVELWRHDPFEPTVEGEYLVARGSTDDKGQFLALVEGIEAILKTHRDPPVNLKVLIEGEEEIGSVHLAPFIRSEARRLACDWVVIADSSQFARDIPAITYGLKGLVYLELVVTGPKKDLHSGAFGGTVANPANVLARMIAACQGPFGRVAIPGFYDDVRPIEDWERDEARKLGLDDEQYRQDTGVPALFGEEGYTTLERKWARPTFDVNGLLSGFTGEGAKTVLPSVARCKFSMRLVPDQEPDKILALTRDYLEEIAPRTVKIEILSHHGARPVLVPRTGKGVQAAVEAYRRGFGRPPVFIREGGSIPVVNTFQAELGAQSLLLGLGLPDDDAHAPNEKFRIEDFHRGAVTMAAFLEELGGK